ncbi:hypothetical protein OMP38_16370 [Cohnella ginsengisoli]|uniref:Uncharacterized protein n=1 Tax=Cohnella ginsengisoli TaxID=425004 RepID=A0A9X4KHU2_9BACL|nr:hypothetical protein [Cohnella ginsengisoli]MDG0792268.1 hypothetical protein [Cohnella ginsengisoli]
MIGCISSPQRDIIDQVPIERIRLLVRDDVAPPVYGHFLIAGMRGLQRLKLIHDLREQLAIDRLARDRFIAAMIEKRVPAAPVLQLIEHRRYIVRGECDLDDQRRLAAVQLRHVRLRQIMNEIIPFPAVGRDLPVVPSLRLGPLQIRHIVRQLGVGREGLSGFGRENREFVRPAERVALQFGFFLQQFLRF